MGNTKLWEGSNNYPARGFYLESGQHLTITTESWPIAPNQQVTAVVTTNNWQSSQEYVFNWDGNTSANSKWYCILPSFNKNTWVQFYLKCQELNNGIVYDNNGGANFGFLVRSAPNWRTGPILQWFETDYKTIMARLPEVVQAGYTAIYLPPPSKSGGGGFSVGYNPFDLFDLGDRLQSGSVKTKYGSTQELQDLIRLAHRFGIEVYVDAVLNHMDNRASTAINKFPGVIPEDFHIHSSADPTNSEINFTTATDFSSEIMNRDLAGLVDIAQEDGNAAQTGTFTLPSYASWSGSGKPQFIRQKRTPQYYLDGNPVAEDVRQYLKRWGAWMSNVIGVDGFRFDAIKHVPPPFFGYAPDQPTLGLGFSNGDANNYWYSQKPGLYLFGENYTSNAYAHKEYLKTGMNLLDFPLFFNLGNIFNSQGFGDLGAALSNAYGVDANGLPYQNGGFASSAGIGFVQTHDNGPPQSNNMASAFVMTRPARALVYYDGNNVQPGDWSHFPKPGRADALGISSDVLPPILDTANRCARGVLVNRYVGQSLYIYERQVNGQGTLLVGLNSRGDFTAQTQTVATSFPPYTVLEDLSGQQPVVTVNSSGNVTITVPSNSVAGNSNNARGYVLYAPMAPNALSGVAPVEFAVSGQVVAPTTTSLPHGTYGTSKTYDATRITGNAMTLLVHTDTSGAAAYAKIDSGVSVAGSTTLSGTAEGLYDRYLGMQKLSDGQFQLALNDLSALDDGLHCVRVRVAKNVPNGAPVFREFTAFFVLSRQYSGTTLDGAFSGPILTGQTKTPSSNSNRLDGIYMSNDNDYLYVNLAGTVDGSEGFTNGYMAWLDLDPGTGSGVTNLTNLRDDSGPATRLLSNRKLTVPSGFGAEIGLSIFRNSWLVGAPESPLASGLGLPYTIGATAGAFKLTSNTVFMPMRGSIAYQSRTNRADSPKGMECALKLRDLFPNGIPAGQQIGIIAGLGTTGEAGTTLASTDPTYETNSGRPAPNPYMTNQILPPPTSITGDPGTNTVALSSYAAYTIQQTTQISNVIVSTVSARTRVPGQTTYSIQVKATAFVPGPIYLLINPGPGGSIVSPTTGTASLTNPGYTAFKISATGLNSGSSLVLTVSGNLVGTKDGPMTIVRAGSGVY